MRVPGIDVDFEVELKQVQLKAPMRVDGGMLTNLRGGDGLKLLFDFDSQMILVRSKRGDVSLVPASSCQAIDVATAVEKPTRASLKAEARQLAKRAADAKLFDEGDDALKDAAAELDSARAEEAPPPEASGAEVADQVEEPPAKAKAPKSARPPLRRQR